MADSIGSAGSYDVSPSSSPQSMEDGVSSGQEDISPLCLDRRTRGNTTNMIDGSPENNYVSTSSPESFAFDNDLDLVNESIEGKSHTNNYSKALNIDYPVKNGIIVGDKAQSGLYSSHGQRISKQHISRSNGYNENLSNNKSETEENDIDRIKPEC